MGLSFFGGAIFKKLLIDNMHNMCIIINDYNNPVIVLLLTIRNGDKGVSRY